MSVGVIEAAILAPGAAGVSVTERESRGRFRTARQKRDSSASHSGAVAVKASVETTIAAVASASPLR